MPSKPPKPCRVPACRILSYSHSGFCEKHSQYETVIKREYDRRRPSSHLRGYNYRWQKYRSSFLKRHPLCAECSRQGRTTLATVVDHIIDHNGDPMLFWDKNNHQPMCKKCHDIKTAKTAAFGRKQPPHKGHQL